MNYPISKIRKDFPVLEQRIKGKPLVFLDTAASSQKPVQVIEGMRDFYLNSYANIHRGLYTLSQKSSTAYEHARAKVQKFINAKSSKEIVFTKNTTESINLVASSLGQSLQAGDEIILSQAEHHANIVPWHFLRQERGIIIKWLPINEDGSLQYEQIDELLSSRTRIVSISNLSNVLGIENDLGYIIEKSHAIGAKVLVDACQSIVHIPIDVQAMDCDFLVMSSHKLYGPSGVGALYGKEELLNELPPYQGGGGMINSVDFDNISYALSPAKFEAGTPAITEAVGMGYAIDYITDIGMANIKEYEDELTCYMHDRLLALDWVKVLGTGLGKSGIFSFYIEDIHPQDISMILNQEGVSVRSGHHCAEPLHRLLKVPFNTSVRASLGLYNTKEDIDIFVTALQKVKDFF